uniref:Coiled-coil domain-containing protein 186 n=1 Tax=Lygus hesperus TaxID=30085 RepID=A0A0K8TA73_LYGHE
MEGKISALKKQCDSANKEKEGMVMRYAKNEKELLDQKKARENLEKKVKEVTKDNEALQAKLKALGAEKAKVSQLLETKNTEVSNAYKEIDKLKDDINSRDIKIKWTQSKLKSEMEDHKECPGMIEKLGQTVKLLEEELDSLKKENLTLQRQLDGSEVNKNIESQLKEHQAKLIMEKHERSELEAKFKELQSKQASLVEENENLSSQVLSLEQERLVATKKVNSLKEERTVLTDKLSQLQENLKEMGHLKEQLKEEREKLILTSTEMERLRKSNEDLAADMSSCRHREAEMLAFTQQLTVKNVQLQSEFSAVEEKASELEKEEVVLEQTSASLKDELEQVKAKLKEEQTKRHEEARLLARQVAEKTTKSLNLEALLTDTQSELNLLRQKHTTALKVLDVPAHTLIERIVKLQNDCAKQTERIEFLEEHTAHLVKELQKKSKLLQNYIMREQTGALTSKVMDRNKAEVSKHGGIMASLYSTKPSESMTLELSMEINRKLQAVLEDTLLKNITLKENLDTLGDEIARLSHKKS